MFIYYLTSYLIIILVYVSDVLVVGSSSTLVSQLIAFLNASFSYMILVLSIIFFGAEVTHTFEALLLSQHKYIMNFLTCTKILTCKLAATPTHVRWSNLASI